jgi:hypothetical protein
MWMQAVISLVELFSNMVIPINRDKELMRCTSFMSNLDFWSLKQDFYKTHPNFGLNARQ